MLQLKNIATATFLLLFTFLAQDILAQRGHRGDIVTHLKKHIELTPEQEMELNAISEKYRSRIEALRNNASEKGANREQIKELHQIQRAEVNKVLTAEQEKILRAKKEVQRAKRKEQWGQVDKKALRTELEQYHLENIHPVLTTQRLQLDSKISAADRATLAQLRTTLKPGKEHQKIEHEKGQRPTKEERSAKRAAFEAKYANELATLESLVQKYASELKSIRTAIQPQVELWQKDTQAITKKYISEGEMEKGHHHKKMHHKVSANLKGKRAKGRFLLMNPSA